MTGIILIIVFLMFTKTALATDINKIVYEMRNSQISLSTITMLETLDSSKENIGYGLCAMGNPARFCDFNGSVGYGLCAEVTKEQRFCDQNGSVGYGLCVAAGNEPRVGKAEGGMGKAVLSVHEPLSSPQGSLQEAGIPSQPPHPERVRVKRSRRREARPTRTALDRAAKDAPARPPLPSHSES